jgi:hypothetical protein
VTEIWFSVVVPLRGRPLPDVHTAEQVARATGRTRPAVERALDQGRLPRASLTEGFRPASGPRRVRYVRATAVDLKRWRMWSLEEVLEEHPDLPQDPSGWISEAALARELGGRQWRARRAVRLLNPPRLQWGVAPWHVETRYWIPDLQVARTLTDPARV